MSDNHSDDKFESIYIEHLCPTRNDEIIRIGADLIPDDIDMYPRNLGSEEMPFRQVWADSFYGTLDPTDERGAIGARTPFMQISAKTFYGNLQGTVNGLPFPGFMSGYGWILLIVSNTTGTPELKIQRSLWPRSNYDIAPYENDHYTLKIHPQLPFMPLTPNSPVMAEITRNDMITHASTTTSLSLNPEIVNSLKVPQVCIPIDIPSGVSVQHHILIKIY